MISRRRYGGSVPRNWRRSRVHSLLEAGTVANPFEGLRPALEVITQEAEVLPATGQAMEDLMRPDHAEVIDRLRDGDEGAKEILLESPNREPYVALRPLHREERHVL